MFLGSEQVILMNGTVSSPRYPHNDFLLYIAQLVTAGVGDDTDAFCQFIQKVTDIDSVLESF
jgi:hypothetical protein